MTVNERLVMSGKLAAWDAAVAGHDRAGMIEVLMSTDLSAKQAAETTDAELSDPQKSEFR
jgi:hypothetical protein